MDKKWRVLLPCYYTFLVNGMMALGVGAIMPYLIEEASLSYSIAGGLLAIFAIGNFIASFVNPPLFLKLGRKVTVISMSVLIPISLYVISTVPSITALYAAFLFLGIGRGSVSIFNNTIVNENSNGSNAALNLLHVSFAVGAFSAPFLTSFYVGEGFGWRALIYTINLLFVISIILWISLPEESIKVDKAMKKQNDKHTYEERGNSSGKRGKTNEKRVDSYGKSVDFYVIGLILFFYLGLENCVNGWFVTYFKGIGIMSDQYATNLVAITWVAVMLGRLVTAWLSNKISKKKLILMNCLFTSFFFLLLIATKNLSVISIAIVGLGFFFAGIYPTCIANAGQLIKGSSSGMSMLLAIAALGGILAPQVVGIVADSIGLSGAIGILTFCTIFMVLLAFINSRRNVIE